MINPYFYNRTQDWTVILSLISPLRPAIQHKLKPSLHYLGLLTNMICILVFIKKGFPKRKSVFFLIMLAFADFMYNFMSVLPHLFMSTRLLNFNIYKTSNLSCFMYDYGIASFHFYSVLLTLLITIDRFNHIHKPLKLYQTLDKLLAKQLVTLGLLLLSLVIALPHGFLMAYNKTENDCDARDFFRQKLKTTNITYYQLYFTFTEPVFIWFVPGILITCLNVYVVYRIIKSNEAYSEKFTMTCGFLNIFKSEQTNIRVQSTKRSSLLEADQISNSSCKCDQLNENENNIIAQTALTQKNNGDIHTELVECLNHKSNCNSSTKCKKKSTIRSTASETLRKNTKKSKLSFNQQSHYLTIVMVGFYFILSTIPYSIVLGLQNNLTLQLNYGLRGKNEYLSDPLWIKFGRLREWVAIFRIIFMSNHCFNFFLYLLFNRLFRKIFFDMVKNFVKRIACRTNRKTISTNI